MNFKKALFTYLNYIKFKLLGKKMIMLGVASGFGDYLWCRNLMYWIRKDIKYKNHAIILITTRRWSDFVNHEDKNIFDIEISIKDPAKVSRSMKNFLHLFHVDTYVQIQHWKDINDNIVTKKYLKRPEYPPKTFIYKYILDYFSKQLKICTDKQVLIPLKLYPTTISGGGQYVVITLGGYAHGSFTKEQIIAMVEIISKNTSFKILLLGENKDKDLFDDVMNTISPELKKDIINGISKFKIWELPSVISECEFVICPNTSVYHIALLLQKPCVCASANDIRTLDFAAKQNEYVLDDYSIEYLNSKTDLQYKPNNLVRICDIPFEKYEKAIFTVLEKSRDKCTKKIIGK